jgi:hypothetical protein
MSHGLTAMAPSGFLSRLTKCAESQDLRLEPLDVRAIVWGALRSCGVNDPIPGFGRLLREF